MADFYLDEQGNWTSNKDKKKKKKNNTTEKKPDFVVDTDGNWSKYEEEDIAPVKDTTKKEDDDTTLWGRIRNVIDTLDTTSKIRTNQRYGANYGFKTEEIKKSNDELIAKNTELLANTQMDGTNLSVLEEMEAVAAMKNGDEKKKRKEAILKKMEELGIGTGDYALYSDDKNFSVGTFLDWLYANTLKGADSFNVAMTRTADVILGQPLQAIGFENNPISTAREYYEKSYAANAYNASLFAEKMGGGKGYQYGGEFVEGTVAGVPDLLLALMTSGTSKGATAIPQLANSAGNILQRAGVKLANMANNPNFWFSFARTYGTDYEEAKARGVNDGTAALGATLSSLLNAGVEVGIDGGSGIQGIPDNIAKGGTNAVLEWVESSLEEGGEEVVQGVISNAVSKVLYDKQAKEAFENGEVSEYAPTKVFDGYEMLHDFALGTAVGSALGGSQIGIQSGISAIQEHQANKLTENEQKVINKIYEKAIADAEKDGTKLTKSEKDKLYDEIKAKADEGGISIDAIAEVLGGDTYKTYKDTIASEDATIAELGEVYGAGAIKTEFSRRLAEAEADGTKLTNKDKSRLYKTIATEMQSEYDSSKNKILAESKRGEIGNQLYNEVFETVKGDRRLVESFNEKARTRQKYQADLTQYTNENARKTIQNIMEADVANNTKQFHNFANMLAKISEDKGIIFSVTSAKKLAETGFAVEGRRINGFIDKANNRITINLSSRNALNSISGHEITHALEGTEFYDEFAKAAEEYAKAKGEYASRYRDAVKLYRDVEGYEGDAGFKKIKEEVIADLVGDYLFTDTDFIINLSTKHRNVFMKMWDEIKYLSKIVTAGSEEARKLEKVKKAFEDAYRGESRADSKTDKKYSLSLVDAVQPTTEGWKRTRTTEEAIEAFPDMWNVAAEESDVRNPTQITSTVKSYRKIYNYLQNEGFNGTILDASSGLGYGTKAGVEEFGFDVEDIEPYPDKGYNPKYTDYSALDKKYDVVISNAVLNVLPQDQRDALVVKMGELLNDGGRMFINVRGKDVETLANTGKNIHLGDMEWIETVKGSYQKGFTKNELKAYLEDALGDGFTVEKTNMFGAVSVVVTKDGGVKYSLSDSKTDKAYLDAVNNRDWDTAQKMVDNAAKKAGYTRAVYHGTESRFTVFDTDEESSTRPQHAWMADYPDGTIFLAEDYDVASQYGDRVMEMYLNTKGMKVFNEPDMYAHRAMDDKYGYEVYNYPVIAVKGKDMTIYANLDNTLVKSSLAAEYDDNGNVIPLSERFNTKNADIRFSLSEAVEESGELMALHNLKSNELLKSLELGGLPMPSIAIIKAEAGHDQYGEISLILPKESIDPQANRDNKVYGGDAWTPTYPRMEYKANDAVAKKISDKYYAMSDEYGSNKVRPLYDYVYEAENALNRSGGESALKEELYDDTRMMQVYLLDSGKGEVPTVQKEIRTELTDNEVNMYEFLAQRLGDEVVNGVNQTGLGSPIEQIKAYWKNHGEAIKEAYGEFLSKEFGFTEEDINNVFSNMKIADFLKIVRDAKTYQTNGRVTIKTEADYNATQEAIREAAGEGYKAWVDDLFGGIEEKSGIRNNKDYFTPSGDRRSWDALHWENTLENVVKAMKQQDRTGSEAVFGVHKFFATASKDYGSVAEIKADADRLHKIDDGDYQAAKDTFEQRFSDIAVRIMDKTERNQFIAMDNAMECIVDAVRESKTQAGIYKELSQYKHLNVTEQDVAEIVSLVNDIGNMPTGYFEAKPMRAVGFDEVGVFVIPRNADTKLKQELLNRGYSIAEYDPDVEGDRQKVVNSFEEYKFSLSAEGETPKKRDPRLTYGEDVLLEQDIAPVQDSVQDATEEVAPIAENSPRAELYNNRGGDNGWGEVYVTAQEALNDAVKYVSPELWKAMDAELDSGEAFTPITNALIAVQEDVRQETITPMQGAQLLDEAYKSGGVNALKEIFNPSTGNLYDRYLEKAKQYGTNTQTQDAVNRQGVDAVEHLQDDIAPVGNTAPVADKAYEAIKPKPEKLTGEEAQWAANKMARADGGDTTPMVKRARNAKPEERSWYETSTQSDAVGGMVTPDDIPDDVRYYQVKSNKKTLASANARLERDGFAKSREYFEGRMASGELTTEDIALGERLIQEAAKAGDAQAVRDLIIDVSIIGTELGQRVQALSLIRRLTPEGQLKALVRTVERAKAKGDKAYDGVEVTDDMAKTITDVYNEEGTFDQAELDRAVEDVKQQIADQMSVSTLDKINAWRYLSMLGNPKTHIRNVFSNIAMLGTRKVKNAIARTMEDVFLRGQKPTLNTEAPKSEKDIAPARQVIPAGTRVRAADRDNIGTVRSFNPNTGKYTVFFENDRGQNATVRLDANILKPLKPIKKQSGGKATDGNANGRDADIAPVHYRTKTWKQATDAVKAFAKQTTKDMDAAINGDNKYSESGSIKAKRKIFGNKVINATSDFNSNALEGEDALFSKPAFRESLQEYLTANGIKTEADIKNNPELVAKAKEYALDEARKATFRQDSYLANKIAEIEQKNPFYGMAVGSIIPFKKTPINIAKTGAAYSPLGFARNIYDAVKVAKGEMDASEAIDHLAQTLTGTSLTLIGYALASAGVLNGAGEDDKEGKYDYQLGKQSYSFNFGGDSYSLSWLSPVAMPLFVGANAYETLVEKNEWDMNVVVDTLAQTLDPMSEMSFLSSLDDVLSSYDSGIQKFMGAGEAMVQNYVTQFVPTLSSQIAATFDDTKRSTKASGTSGFEFGEETVKKIMYKIPGLRNTLEPTTDIWGDEVKQNENVFVRAFDSLLSPANKRAGISTMVDDELKSLYGETGDASLIPSIPYDYINYDGVKYDMSADEYTAYKQTYGQTALGLMVQLFDTNTYKSATSEERADMVSRVYDYARDKAKYEYLLGHGVLYTNAQEDGVDVFKEDAIKGAIEADLPVDEYTFSQDYPEKYKFFNDAGISYSTYKTADEDGKRAYTWAYENPSKYEVSKAITDDFMEYYGYKREIGDIADANDSSSGVKDKDLIMEYIFSLNLDYGQRAILYRSMYDSKDDIANYNMDIVNYLNSRDDISYEQMVTILRELGFTVDSNGNIYW